MRNIQLHIVYRLVACFEKPGPDVVHLTHDNVSKLLLTRNIIWLRVLTNRHIHHPTTQPWHTITMDIDCWPRPIMMVLNCMSIS